MNVSTPLGRILAALVILALVIAIDAIQTPLFNPVEEYLSFVLTEEYDFAPWVASARRAYDGLWSDWTWPTIRPGPGGVEVPESSAAD